MSAPERDLAAPKPIGYCANCVERCEYQHGPCFSEEIGCTEDFRPDDTESTSAALARVTAERDTALDLLREVGKERAELAAELVSARTELEQLRAATKKEN
jgi:hypothetical protein